MRIICWLATRWAAVVILAAAVLSGAEAQLAPDTAVGKPSEQRPPLPKFEDELPQPEFVLPPIEPPAEERLSTAVTVFVRGFAFVGNTTLSDDELAAVTAPYEGRELTTADLYELRDALTRAYIERGYINTGAVIPDQDVADGIVTMQIVEGQLTAVQVTGNVYLRDGFIANRLRGREGETLSVNDLRDRMQLLLQDPFIERLNSELGPGVEVGEAELRVAVEEDRPFHLFATVDNHTAPSVGAEGGELTAVVRGLTGWGETVELSFRGTEGLINGAAHVDMPVTRWNTFLRFGYKRDEANIVEDPFNDIDIESSTESIELSLDHPFYRTPQRQFIAGVTMARRDSVTFLLGEPFSFSPGVEDGESTVAALRFYQEWTDRTLRYVVAARSTFSLGIDALGATKNVDAPDGQFFAWLGQFQVAHRLWDSDNQVIFRADGQFTPDSLLPIEKFAVGGAESVRGYRENQLVRDNGFILSLEGRVPVYRLAIPVISERPEDGMITLAPFFDFGRSWNNDLADPTPRSIYSTGLGLRWSVSEAVQLELYWGYAFEDIDNPDHDLQDDGIHFRLSTRLY